MLNVGICDVPAFGVVPYRKCELPIITCTQLLHYHQSETYNIEVPTYEHSVNLFGLVMVLAALLYFICT